MYGVCNIKGHVLEICGRVYITIRIDGNIVECYVGREPQVRGFRRGICRSIYLATPIYLPTVCLCAWDQFSVPGGARKHSKTLLDVVLICSHWLRASPSR